MLILLSLGVIDLIMGAVEYYWGWRVKSYSSIIKSMSFHDKETEISIVWLLET